VEGARWAGKMLPSSVSGDSLVWRNIVWRNTVMVRWFCRSSLSYVDAAVQVDAAASAVVEFSCAAIIVDLPAYSSSAYCTLLYCANYC
jgi:hypothetical protein